MAEKGKKDGRGSVVIRREEVIEGGHHGGAWKVAYADFVTAMMAFFLLMWLLNATTEAQRKGLADYFTPSNALSHASSGAGHPFGGHTPYDSGEMVSDRGVATPQPGTAAGQEAASEQDADPPSEPQHPPAPASTDPDADHDGPAHTAAGQTAHAISPAQSASPQPATLLAAATAAQPNPQAAQDAGTQAEQAKRERAAFDSAAAQIRDAVQQDPALSGLLDQLAIDQTPEGLRIQLLDEERRPMFATGSAAMNDRARLLLQKMAPVLARLSEPISIAGHTDAAPYKGDGKTNWDLSSERANTTRRLLGEDGLQEARFRSVTGNADRDPLLPADPLAAANRRIAIVVLRRFPPPQVGN